MGSLTTVVAPPAARPLWEHQEQALDLALAQRGYLLGIPMGGGKSRVAIDVADRTDATRVLVLCPKSVVGVWPRQLREHSERDWTIWAGHVESRNGGHKASATVAERAEALTAAAHGATRIGRPFLAACNFESVRSAAMADTLLSDHWDLVIVDESHRVKAPMGRDSRFVGRLCRRTRLHGGRVLLLTGTPMPHSALDLWGQMRAIDEDILGRSYTAFRARYGAPRIKFLYADGTPAYLTTPGGQVIYDGVRDDRVDELMARVAPYMFTVDADELDRKLGLLEPRDVYRETELDPASRRVYQDLERDLVSRVGEGVVTASNAMVLVTRLAQATSGYAVDAETREHIGLADDWTAIQAGVLPEKARLLADVLSDLPPREPVVVFARFHEDLDNIERVAVQAGRSYGELSGRRRDGLTADSTMVDVDVLGAQLQSGGVGIDLTRARYAVYYSLDFSLANYLQSRKRLHRPGQDGRVTYIHLTCTATIDEVVHSALARREQVVDAVLARLKGESP